MSKKDETIKVSSESKVQLPLANLIGIIIIVSGAVMGWANLTGRIQSLETSRELMNADLLKKSEQTTTDQEQFLLLETLFSDVEKLQKTQEQNMTNKVNIEFTKQQLEKALEDIEKLKDKVRENGSHQ